MLTTDNQNHKGICMKHYRCPIVKNGKQQTGMKFFMASNDESAIVIVKCSGKVDVRKLEYLDDGVYRPVHVSITHLNFTNAN